jgi:hypothetical protein
LLIVVKEWELGQFYTVVMLGRASSMQLSLQHTAAIDIFSSINTLGCFAVLIAVKCPIPGTQQPARLLKIQSQRRLGLVAVIHQQ